MKRLKIYLSGIVQGVGFRPFVYRLAKELGLKGFVLNDTTGVEIEVEGGKELLDRFLYRLNSEKPPLARIYSQRIEFSEPIGYTDFEIRESGGGKEKDALVPPDITTCEDCLRELFDPADRRYMYPFINCTNCGPRFTIIESLPYDRPATTMKDFSMCPECEREYGDPTDRRFHAQPNACPRCGPWVSLYNKRGELLAQREEAIELVVEALSSGSVIALKGVGGFHLLCDATKEDAVRTLRERKRRAEKPFAVMFKDIGQVLHFAEPTELEKGLLLSPERPIVLVRKKNGGIAPSVAPDLVRIGAFLPYSPLHHVLLSKLPFPVVATSGNLSDEPIVKDDEEALSKLSSLADLILIHNRPIKRRCDDSVVKVIGGIPTPIRRSRGYVPTPIELPFRERGKVLAVGGMLKNTFAFTLGDRVVVSQHVGDVDNLSTLEAFGSMVMDLLKLYDLEVELVVCDAHPRYETTRWARDFATSKGIPLVSVQHHYAHVLSCMSENGVKGEVLGIAWDGTGYGNDGTLWGGEFLVANYRSFERAFYFKPFRLIGGEKAIREPRRVAVSVLFELFGGDALKLVEYKDLENLYVAWEKGINSPYSSSVGRLFDAVASLIGLRHTVSYEGQAAMILEEAYDPTVRDNYPFDIRDGVIDWRPVFEAILSDKREKVPSRFINTLARICLSVAREVGIGEVCLSGGVMQNDPLLMKIKELLRGEGFTVHTHQKVPPNDGGLSLGQAVWGTLYIRREDGIF